MTRWTAIFILLAALLARANGAADNLGQAGVREFTAAYQAWDGKHFAIAADRFRQATTNAPGNSTNFYWLGVAEFHRRLQLQNQAGAATNKPAAAMALDAALAALGTAVKLNPSDAESHALLATLYGMKIDGNLIRGARFGPRIAAHRQPALEFGAKNPRVHYLLGTCQFHTAKKAAAHREALATFLKAQELFEAEAKTPAGPLDPRWGYDTCLTFIGRTYEQLGDRTKAADYFRKALALHPADHLAKDGLARVTEGK